MAEAEPVLEPGIADSRSEFAGEEGWNGPTPGPWPGVAPAGGIVHELTASESLRYERMVAGNQSSPLEEE